jgi:hypothetical protein
MAQVKLWGVGWNRFAGRHDQMPVFRPVPLFANESNAFRSMMLKIDRCNSIGKTEWYIDDGCYGFDGESQLCQEKPIL